MNEIDQLKHLLVGRECRDLDELQSRVLDRSRRTRDVADVLPEAVRVRGAADERLSDALQVPVERCIRLSIERDSRSFAAALFPVMGPAIRRAIAETLKSFVHSINQAVEHSLSLRGLAWRWEAMRGGVPFAAVVLKHTLVYRVEAAYLIHNASGMLIDHAVATTHTTLKDEDAISAMLTAIEGFVEEAFSGVGEGGLETVEVGERTLWLIKGPEASIACLISGIPPSDLRSRLESVLAEIHAVYGAPLGDFRGDKAGLEGVQDLLERALALEYRDGEAAQGRRLALWPWILAAILLLVVGGWLWWQAGEQRQRLAGLKQRLDAEPGILVVDWRQRAGTVDVKVLRDPLAPDPSTLVTGLPLDTELRISVTPFQSLEPPLVLERARRLLHPPPDVELNLEDSTLHVRGVASPDWVERVSSTLVLPPGVDVLDLSGVSQDLSGLPEAVRDALQPPGGVTLSLVGRSLSIGGVAPWEWIGTVAARLRRVDLVETCELDGLQVGEWDEARGLIAELEATPVFFTEGETPAPKAEQVLTRAAEILDRLGALDHSLRLRLRVRLVGHSDGIGGEVWNQWLRQRRADLVREALIDGGLVPELLAAEADEAFRPSPVPVPTLRRVDFSVSASPPDLPSCAP